MKKLVLNRQRPVEGKTLPAISYLLLIAFIAALTGGSFHAEPGALLFPSALISLLLLFGIAGKKMLHVRKRGGNVGLTAI
jgi:hypothetical protein